MDYVYLNATEDVGDSIMFSMTRHRGRTCLTADDLEGLNFLYPVCKSVSQSACQSVSQSVSLSVSKKPA